MGSDAGFDGELGLAREVLKPHCLVRTAEGTGAGGARSATIKILGSDPRLVLAISIWVERDNDADGSSGLQADVASGVTWTLRSAVNDSKNNFRTMKPASGYEDRVVRPATAWNADGELDAGDTVEVSASTPLLVTVRISDPYGVLASTLNQTVWASIYAYPSDAIPDHTGEIFRETLNKVKAIVEDQPIVMAVEHTE